MTARRCTTCGGRGRVDKVLEPGVYGFGKWPTETCPNCYGSGWTGQPDGPMTIPDPTDSEDDRVS